MFHFIWTHTWKRVYTLSLDSFSNLFFKDNNYAGFRDVSHIIAYNILYYIFIITGFYNVIFTLRRTTYFFGYKVDIIGFLFHIYVMIAICF